MLVNEIDPESPAARAGIRVMDVIRKINGEAIASYPDAREALYGSLVGDIIELEVEREGRLDAPDPAHRRVVRRAGGDGGRPSR